MSEAHARLSPSNHRWPHCPGSVREEARYPEVSGAAAVDGTGSHLLLELCMKHGQSASEYEGQTIGVGHPDMPLGWVVHADRIDRVNSALAYIERRKAELRELPGCVDVRVTSESNAPAGHYFRTEKREDWWGTCDITFEAFNGAGALIFVEIADYKDGRGYVKAEGNSQLESYALGKLAGWLFIQEKLPLRLTIIQPKTNPVIRYEDITREELDKRGRVLLRAAQATDDGNAPCTPGWWCEWCKASPKRGGHCTAAIQESEKEVSVVTGDIGLGALASFDIENATEEQLSALKNQEKVIFDLFSRISKEIEKRLKDGATVPGWGMVPGRSSRVWADDDQVIDALKKTRYKLDEFCPRKLISPAQAEKLLSKRAYNSLSSLVIEQAGSPRLGAVKLREAPKQDIFAGVPDVPAASVAPVVPSFL